MRMSKLLKQFIGIYLALTLIGSGIANPYFNVSSPQDSKELSFSGSDLHLGEFTGLSYLSLGSDPTTTFSEKVQITAIKYPDYREVYSSFHFRNQVQTLFKISRKTFPAFGIKELKFPKHYFW